MKRVNIQFTKHTQKKSLVSINMVDSYAQCLHSNPRSWSCPGRHGSVAWYLWPFSRNLNYPLLEFAKDLVWTIWNFLACNSIIELALIAAPWIPMHSVYIVIPGPGPGVPGFPGHGLVAWYLGPDMCYWETTRTWSSKYQREKYSSEEYWKGGGMLHEILETDSRGSTNDP